MTFNIREITIPINNQLIIICVFYFVMSYFFAYLFKQSNIFFKIPVFIFIMTVFSLVQTANTIEITLSSLLGVLVVYGESVLNFIFMLKSWLDFVFYSIKSIFIFIFDTFKAIFYFIAQCLIFPFRLLSRIFSYGSNFRGFNRTTQKPHKDDLKEKSRMEEELRRAREEVRQAREQAKRKESKPNMDNDSRSPQEILGLSANFTESELKQAYRLAVGRYHPDKYAHMSKEFQEEAGREFVKIQQAYSSLIKVFN